MIYLHLCLRCPFTGNGLQGLMTNYILSLRFCYNKGKTPSHTTQVTAEEGKFDYQKSAALKFKIL